MGLQDVAVVKVSRIASNYHSLCETGAFLTSTIFTDKVLRVMPRKNSPGGRQIGHEIPHRFR